MADIDILIIGAGPTGLGAAWRLNELGNSNWFLVEKSTHAGGLASSMKDEGGFVWDIGGHVLFSHYKYFDELMDKLLGDKWIKHERESWVWIDNRFVPYPLQNNIRRLSQKMMWECLEGIIKIYESPPEVPPRNFKEWARNTFGDGIYRHFMESYNLKVWAYPMEKLAYDWIEERVSVIDFKKTLYNIVHEKDDLSWGPNNTFRFPLYGGTGKLWRALADNLPQDKIKYNSAVQYIDTNKKMVKLSTGEAVCYKNIISTMPLDLLIKKSDLKNLETSAQKLLHSSVYVVGFGLKGSPPEKLKTKCWMYFPEPSLPFYRATVFSNYSPNNVPDIKNNWSLMCEVGESPQKPVNRESIAEEVRQGLLSAKLISEEDEIVSKWRHFAPYAYPVPSLERDSALSVILPYLEEKNIYSRGRFGAWKYEVGNMDHSLMQGLECADRIILEKDEITVRHPNLINSKIY